MIWKGQYVMNEKRQTRGAEEIESRLLREALEEEMGDIPELSITVEELKALDLEKRVRSRRKRAKILCAAAAVILCLSAVLAIWPRNAAPADAAGDFKQRAEESGGAVVINDGKVEGSSGLKELCETDWNAVPEIKKQYPRLCIPEYIPAQYQFESLSIEAYSSDIYEYKYQFKGTGGEEMLIMQVSAGEKEASTSFIENYDKSIMAGGETIYAAKSRGRTDYTVLKNKYKLIVSVPSSFPQDEVIKLYQSVK